MSEIFDQFFDIHQAKMGDDKKFVVTGCAKLSALFQIELFYPDFDKHSIINIILRLIEWYSGTGI